MTLVFLGDVSIPPGLRRGDGQSWPRFACPAVANLEGPILEPAAVHAGSFGVWNAPEVLDFLSACGVRAMTLANNHIQDLGADCEGSRAILSRSGIGAFGAGSDLAAAAAPLLLESAGATYALLGFGWGVIGGRAAAKGRGGVNPLRPRHVLDSIAATRRQHPGAHLAVYMHWDFEGELYPQPAHRKLAFDAIEAGAEIVVGCHPHCVQGIEVHRGCPIVYSLGNWLLAWGSYWGGKLSYPEFMRRELAFEWAPETGDHRCHWFDYDPATHSLRAVATDALADSVTVRELTPFNGMSASEYRAWFSANRRKRRMLPVYSDIDSAAMVACKDAFVRTRQTAIDAMVRLGLKGGPR
jgi:poly-gamma-glutamate synthesis protein (capsule biosynthesis protein)